MRQCPAHADASPSLSVRAMEDGVSVKCFGGCSTEEVLAALHCTWAHLWRPPVVTASEHHRTWGRSSWPTFPAVVVRGGHPAAAGLRLVAVHTYGGDENGWLLERWRHPVTGSKDIKWHTVRDGVSILGLFGVPTSELPLYMERQVRMAVGAGEPVIVCESESSVDALMAVGLYATTWASGASAPNLDRLADVLVGADVVLVPDNDPPGLACGRAVWSALRPVASSLRVVMPAENQDARDLLAARGRSVFVMSTEQ